MRETDDVRGGMGLAGAAEFQKFVEDGGVLVTMGVASYFPAEFGIAKGVDAQNTAPGFYAPGPYVNSEILIPTHPTMFGYAQKTLPVRYAGGPLLQAGPPAGFEQFAGSSPDRPQVVARFTGGEAGVLSGLMRNPDQIRNRPMVVDAPSGKGRVILFANNPIYRWQTFGEHAMVFNALLFWNDMPPPETAKPPTSAAPAVVSARLVEELPHQSRVLVVGLEPDVDQRTDQRNARRASRRPARSTASSTPGSAAARS